jgi:HPt (histidine-containing phosphotransfer) domain-containing protein
MPLDLQVLDHQPMLTSLDVSSLEQHPEVPETPNRVGRGMPTDAVCVDETEPPLHVPQLIERCLGSVDVAKRVLGKFEECFRNDLQQMEKALATDDGEDLARLAHRIKGSAANVAAPGITLLSRHIEESARDGQLQNLTVVVDRLRQEWERYTAFQAANPLSSAQDATAAEMQDEGVT